MQPVPAGTPGTKGYGAFEVLASGAWTYTLDNGHAAVQALAAGETLTDTIVVTSADGTDTETITITITGTNDAPVLTGDLSAPTTEGASYQLTSADLGFTDPDDGPADVTFTVSNFVNGEVRVNGVAASTFYRPAAPRRARDLRPRWFGNDGSVLRCQRRRLQRGRFRAGRLDIQSHRDTGERGPHCGCRHECG